MPRKVILDCDPGIDDALAMALALFEPRLEVVGINAVAGAVSAEQASRNVQALVERLDPPRYPRLGSGMASENSPPVDRRHLFGDDGLAGLHLAVSQLHRQFPAEKLLCEEMHAAPDEVVLLTLGPLTNVARALRRDPALASRIHRMIVLGGSLHGMGDVTAAAEFNMYYDPTSAQQVLTSPITKTLLPHDVAQSVFFSLDLMDALPPLESKTGALLRPLLAHAFRAARMVQGAEVLAQPAAAAVAAVMHPELFTTREMTCDVETAGTITTGATVFDRRPRRTARPNMEVVSEIDADAVKDCILRGWKLAGGA